MAVTKTIGKTAGDYATIALWLAFVNVQNLASTGSQIGECWTDTGELSIASNQTAGGWTNADATHTVTLDCGAAQSFATNAGKLTNALRYNTANGVGVKIDYGYAAALTVTGTFFTIDGLQFNVPTITNLIYAVKVDAANCIIQNSIFQGLTRGAGGAGSLGMIVEVNNVAPTIQNVLVIVKNSGTVGDGISLNSTGTLTDCTVFAPSGSTGTGITVNYTTPTVTNCAVAGFTTDYAGTANAASTKNATDKGSFGGTNFGGSGQVSLVAATEWTVVTSGSEDMRLASGSAKLKNNGATVGPSNDIVGTSRPQGASYDIGCWELAVASGLTAGELAAVTNPQTSRMLSAKPFRLQQAYFGPNATLIAPPAFGWFQPLSQPRVDQGLISGGGQVGSAAQIDATELVTLDKWYSQFSQPLQRGGPLRREAFFAPPATLPAAPNTLDKWYVALSQPLARARPILTISSVIPPVQTSTPPETITVDKWLVPLSQPKPRITPVQSRSFFGPEQLVPAANTVDKWLVPLSQPQRRVNPPLSQSYFAPVIVSSVAPEVVTVDKWLVPLSQPWPRAMAPYGASFGFGPLGNIIRSRAIIINFI